MLASSSNLPDFLEPKGKKKSSTIGTVAQMAPEFIKEKITSTETDVYAFGIVLWEIMTRQVAYIDKEEVQIMYGVAH